ncbi:hypothetical protein A2954_04480 [Candidatus Roizmanbacteria bacterium RIFCSPLOWO2_01_FULL_37_12]|uniref:Uncharacterized protein n=1 Tax=Candidatus Roizmanbacteria bacterium RIFCSPLOWO2_01_FULL_37_12 TaxID=1802056 RepID=A0A1F7IFU0_9BACT|nr:MAG: hypothetical protein A3D76_06420 [Candidatus Roizmanbacteria bacterium RIFCSPHIGHO2_02_FULL_37_9b]OGK42238.1 MAG: hypothetical protein A2954_04480 [Candidatus Roizmanbacteria bacterium RIFCSPLOWO2_01_FULL_37_12]
MSPKRSKEHKRPKEHESYALSKKAFLQLGVVVLGALGVTTLIIAIAGQEVGPKGPEFPGEFDDEGKGGIVPGGEMLQPGDLVSDREVARIVSEYMRSGVDVYPEPTIIESIYYNNMVRNGVNPDLAERRARSTRIANNSNYACSDINQSCQYDSLVGLVAEINEHEFKPGNPEDWIRFVGLRAHESFVLSVAGIEDDGVQENYGVLGTRNIYGEARGFWATNESSVEIDLISPEVYAEGREWGKVNLPLYFYGEAQVRDYYKR